MFISTVVFGKLIFSQRYFPIVTGFQRLPLVISIPRLSVKMIENEYRDDCWNDYFFSCSLENG